MKYKIHVIDLQYKNRPRGIAAFVVATPSGPIVVETGPHSTFDILCAGIGRLGYKVEDVKHVFLTHIHLDHAGAAWCFAKNGAVVYVHPNGIKHLHNPSRLLASAKMIYQDEMDRLWGTLKPIPLNQLVQVEDEQIIRLGELSFKAWHTPGHAKHHIAWQLESDLFTGDVAGVRINNGPVIPPCPPPDINIELWIESIDRVEAIPGIEKYHLTHFGPVVDLQQHLIDLKSALSRYADFVYPYYVSGRSIEEFLPQFRQFVHTYLVEKGMHPDDAVTYEAANPSDMNAAGLLRYWSKRIPHL